MRPAKRTARASGVYVVFREERPGVSRSRPVLRTMSRYVAGTYPRVGSLLRLSRLERRDAAERAAAAPTIEREP